MQDGKSLNEILSERGYSPMEEFNPQWGRARRATWWKMVDSITDIIHTYCEYNAYKLQEDDIQTVIDYGYSEDFDEWEEEWNQRGEWND